MRVKAMRGMGLTLIELLMALAIVGILAAIGYPAYQNYVDRTNNAQAVSDIMSIEPAIALYQHEHDGALPQTLADIGMDTLRDPWGNPYQYLNISTTKGKGKVRKDKKLVPLNTDYDLYSKGKDGKSNSPLTAEASRDDIVRANNGGFVGLGADY